MRSFNQGSFQKKPVIGILRGVQQAHVMPLLNAYVEAGFTTVEITIDTVNAGQIISNAVKEFGERLNIGAGTVLNENDLNRALQAGAQFIVTPVVHETVITQCVRSGIPVFPGAFTSTEIVKAWDLGATMVKVFPLGSMGVEYIKALKAPLKHVKLLPTGGITIENVRSYFEAGAHGVGVSTGLFKKTFIKNEDWEGLAAHLASFFHSLIDIDSEISKPFE